VELRVRRPSWTTVVPVAGLVVLAATWGRDLPTVVVVGVAGVLAAAVLVSVHHAEVVAHRVGEPLGSLVLAVAVTVIEVGLIVSLMVSGGDATGSLARDTVFAAVMITTNGIVGLALLIGGVPPVRTLRDRHVRGQGTGRPGGWWNVRPARAPSSSTHNGMGLSGGNSARW
jgi:Ca2+:H+ antiporter